MDQLLLIPFLNEIHVYCISIYDTYTNILFSNDHFETSMNEEFGILFSTKLLLKQEGHMALIRSLESLALSGLQVFIICIYGNQ